RLLAVPPKQAVNNAPELPVQIGDVVRIYMRRSFDEARELLTTRAIHAWPKGRILEVEWDCPHCAQRHRILIPESWIAEGKAVFVESAEGEEA
ncbi:MAG: hypothetical protein K2N07_10820, partial [Desulfovibrio sp.]|nr:hypothetical protein [Desulfovibrio sp.]